MRLPKVILQIETSRACGRGIILGISKYCSLFSRWRLSQSLPYYFDTTNKSPNIPENWVADGVIIGTGEIPESIRQLGIPVVGIDIRKPIFNMPNIIGDNNSIAGMATNHFIDRGFSQLAYCGFSGISWAVERGFSFVNHAKEQGVDVAKYEIQNSKGQFIWDDAIIEIGGWLRELSFPLGLLACNDDCAKLISVACESEGIRVPEDVAILGVDNDEMICLMNDPPLSSIVLDFEKAGFEAAELLDKIIKGQEESASQRIVLQATHIKVRQSTDILAIHDPEIQMALRFIRDNADHSIAVPDVVEATTQSRRGLEYRFKGVLGRSINKVIRSERAERVARMLIETNSSVSQIAYELDFTDIEHISRFFSSVKGISPTAFRKQHGKLNS